MIQLGFFLFLALFFYGIGAPFLHLLRAESDSMAFSLPSGVGLVLATVAVTLFYKFGGDLHSFFWISCLIATVFLLFYIAYRWRGLLSTLSSHRLELVAAIVFALLVWLPAIIGGEQFTIFQGNHHDTFNYLEAAATYREMPYQTIVHSEPVSFLRLGLFPYAKDILAWRPEAEILYGALSELSPGNFLRLHYIFLIYFQFLSFCTVQALAVELLPSRKLIATGLAFALVGGFWGQYIVDINAWSQIAAMPLVVLSFVLLIRLFPSDRRQQTVQLPPRETLLYALSWLGIFYLYPEAAGFLLPGHLCCLFWGIYRYCLRSSWRFIGALAVIGAVLLIPVFKSNVLFLSRQSAVSVAGVNWWIYFQAFLFGNDGINPDFFANTSDFLAGIFGIYFITPTIGMLPLIANALRVIPLAIAALFLIHLARNSLAWKGNSWSLTWCFAGVSLTMTLLFCLLGQYWSAGKAFSFVAYLILLPLFASVFRLSIPKRWSWGRIERLGASFLLALQLGFLSYRPMAVHQPFGVQYPFPYPAVQDPKLKMLVNFADWSFLHDLRTTDLVSIQIDDPWIQSFARMLLISNHIRVCLAEPVFEYRGAKPTTVPPEPCPESTCRLVSVKSTGEPFANRLVVFR